MIEIIVLFLMGRYLHSTATKKGWPGWPFVLLMIFGWFVCAIGGGVVGMIVTDDWDSELPVGGIVGYFVGAVFACVGNALVVAMLPNKAVDDDRDYSTRRRGRRYDEGEDNDDPRDRRGRRYDRDDDDRDDRRGRRRDDD